MKKYVVLRWFKSLNPSVLFTCDNKSDAEDYARIMSHQDEYIYSVAEVSYTIGG